MTIERQIEESKPIKSTQVTKSQAMELCECDGGSCYGDCGSSDCGGDCGSCDSGSASIIKKQG